MSIITTLLRICVLILSIPAVLLRRLYHRYNYDRANQDSESLLGHEFKDFNTQGWTMPSLRSLINGLKNVAPLLRPTIFLQHWSRAQGPRKLRPTAWLDGLRGVAALIVCIHHFCAVFVQAPFAEGWGRVDQPKDHYHVFQLFPIRIFTSGNFMVAIFFIISGYVLSQRALQLARGRQYTKVFESLSSSVFRRWIRLMLPAVASIFMNFVVKMCFPGYRHRQSLFNHLRTFYYDALQTADPIRLGMHKSKFNNVLWTIQFEFMGSILVYLLVLGLFRTRPAVRITIVSAITLHMATSSGKAIFTLFTVGLLIAELDIISKSRLGNMWTNDTLRNTTFFTFVIGLYLGTHPKYMNVSPGYVTLYNILPPAMTEDLWGFTKFYLAIGAILVVGSINLSPMLQRPFTTAFAQYLGEVSFSLYVVHYCVLDLLKPVMPSAVAFFNFIPPDYTGLRYWCGTMLILIFGMPFTFWISELWTLYVDVKSVKLAKDFEMWAFAGPEADDEGIRLG
jgi:peptidoglycan/LPS O-acetylase OafA/YrhL